MERWQLGDEWKSRICPRKLITDESHQWLRLFASYRAGYLLEAGGILDQPAIYISTMNAIDGYVARANREWSQKPKSA